MKKNPKDPDMREHYSFKGAVRGKHFEAYSQGTNVVLLEADVAEVFPDSESVNRALRELIAAGKTET
jgi:hypothetical protein